MRGTKHIPLTYFADTTCKARSTGTNVPCNVINASSAVYTRRTGALIDVWDTRA